MPTLHRTLTLLTTMGLALTACGSEPQALPSQVAAEQADAVADRAEYAPLVQLLYDQAFLPETQHRQQRVRILIWLRHMELGDYQLRALAELAERTEAQRANIEALQAEQVAQVEPALTEVYDQLWEQLSAGVALDDPALAASAGPLLEERLEHARSQELLNLRLQGVQSILEAERPWLSTLSPKQEALLSDSLFLLRHRLDPYANPGDFKALVGTIFAAGDYGTLTRGSFSADTDHLDLAQLWGDQSKAQITGPVFSNARRELLLYMILLEPALPEAIEAALGPQAEPEE